MNGKDLLIGLGYIGTGYFEEAERDGLPGKTSGGKYARTYRPFRKPLLIAAILALMLFLVGCTVVYVLSLQDLKVGEHSYLKSVRSENGEQIATEEKTGILISLQNVHQEALAEWLAFQESYDRDGSLMAANDNNESGIPESYYYIYDCYTWDMVEKLEEIAGKYDLQLLSADVGLQYYEHSVLFDALKIGGLIEKEAPIEVEYLSSSFYLEGTFDMDFLVTPADDGKYEELSVSMRYSLKEYFDPVVGALGGDFRDYEQWNYTREDGTALLLALDADSARIYADLPQAFVSVHMNTDGGNVSMTKELLEEIAGYFDFSVQPQRADMEEVERLLEQAGKDHEADRAAANRELYNNGYAAYIKQLLEKVGTPSFPVDAEYLTYALYDVNGDETEELIVCGYGALYDIISMRDGESFHYFDANALPATPVIYICENNVIEIYDYSTGSHYYFKAEAEGASFIVGLYTNENVENSQWELFSDVPNPDPSQRVSEDITEEEASSIIAAYPRIELEMKPISQFPKSENP